MKVVDRLCGKWRFKNRVNRYTYLKSTTLEILRTHNEEVRPREFDAHRAYQR